jgi:hypothetical protein
MSVEHEKQLVACARKDSWTGPGLAHRHYPNI